MKHVKEHTLEKPFQCGNCEKTFIDEHMLMEHSIIHTGENIYQCTFCDKTFSHKEFFFET